MTAITSYQSNLDSRHLLAMVNDRYGQGFTRCRFWTHGQNDTYLLEGARGERAMLRVYAHRWRSLADVSGELAFIEYLVGRGVGVSGCRTGSSSASSASHARRDHAGRWSSAMRRVGPCSMMTPPMRPERMDRPSAPCMQRLPATAIVPAGSRWMPTTW